MEDGSQRYVPRVANAQDGSVRNVVEPLVKCAADGHLGDAERDALEDLSDDHVPGTVHIVPLLGGHAVPAGEPELLPSINLSQRERGTRTDLT